MAISLTNLIAMTGSDTDASSYTTADVTPTAGSIILACFVAFDAGLACNASPSVSGIGLTWSRAGFFYDSGRQAICMATAYVDPAVLTTGGITFDTFLSSGTADGAMWCVVQIDGGDPSYSNNRPYVQSAINNGSADSLTITLGSAFRDPNDLALSFCNTRDNAGSFPTLTIPTGWNSQTTTTQTMGSTGHRATLAHLENDTTANWSAQSINDFMGGCAIEIGIAPAAPLTRRYDITAPTFAVERASRW